MVDVRPALIQAVITVSSAGLLERGTSWPRLQSVVYTRISRSGTFSLRLNVRDTGESFREFGVICITSQCISVVIISC